MYSFIVEIVKKAIPLIQIKPESFPGTNYTVVLNNKGNNFLLKVTIEVFDGATTQVRQAFTDYNLSKSLTTNVTMMPLIYQKNQIQIPFIYPKYTYIQYGDKQ